MRPTALLAATGLALALSVAACDEPKTPSARDAPMDVDAGESVASLKTANGSTEIAIPGLSATLKIPALDMGRDMDISGVKLFPGSKVTTMDARHRDHGEGGFVRLDVASPAPPSEVARYYREQAAAHDFTVDPAGGDARIEAVKEDERLSITLAPTPGGSTTRIVAGDTD